MLLAGFACKFSGLILHQSRQECTYISDFFSNLLGAIPLILLLGGLMAGYLGYDEVKEKFPFCKAGEPSNDAKLIEEAARCKEEAKDSRGTGQEQDQLESSHG